jgi:DNA-binding NarL/FixJ family response regulator
LNFKNNVYVGEYSVPMDVFGRSFTEGSFDAQLQLPHKMVQVYHNGSCIEVKSKEWKVIEFIAKGYSAKEIALQMNLSPRTIEDKINNLKYIFNIQRRFQFFKIWHDNQIL